LFDLGKAGRFRPSPPPAPVHRHRSRPPGPAAPPERRLARDWATGTVYAVLIAVVVLQAAMVWWISAARL